MNKKINKELISFSISLFSLVLIFALWAISSALIKTELIMPSPKSVFLSLSKLFRQPSFYKQILFTTLRSISAFAISFALSIIIGFACGMSEKLQLFFNIPLGIIKAAPVVSFILPALFWFSTGTVPIFVSVLMTLPIMTHAIAEGCRNTDGVLLKMSSVYKLSWAQKFKYIYLKSVIPYIKSGAVSAFAMSWKVVVASEVISLPKTSAGNALYTAKVHLETADVFAISIIVIAISFILERLISLVMNRSK